MNQPFAIGSHLSCSLTSKSYASRACASSPLSIGSEFSERSSPASAPSLGGDTDIMYRLAADRSNFPLAALAKTQIACDDLSLRKED